jgi:hypothetical protein
VDSREIITQHNPVHLCDEPRIQFLSCQVNMRRVSRKAQPADCFTISQQAIRPQTAVVAPGQWRGEL